MPEITKIVITGGPCGGKSTAERVIRETFTELGYTVLFISETATELISGGVAPWSFESKAQYQLYQMQLQLEKEKVFTAAAMAMPVEKVLLVCDRGAMDNKAYMSEAEFEAVLDTVGCNEVELRDGYDAVFHLVSAAKGAERFYTVENNSARTETLEEAAALDDRVIAAWTGQTHFRVIDNSTDFEGKMQRLITEISSFLGVPEPLEIERKFLIEYPDINWLESLPNCRKVEIVQTYLKSEPNEETRVRQRGANGNYVFFKTTKKKVSEIKRVEIEGKISKEEYLELLLQTDTSKRQIRKTRYCLTFEGQYFEIDVYPFWNDRAVVELELATESYEISFPPQLKVIKEVTDDVAYKNSSLAEIKN